MVIKRLLKKLQTDVLGEVIRDYSDITQEPDGLNVRLKRQGKSAFFAMSFASKELGKATFDVPVTTEAITALKAITEDIKLVRKNSTANSKELRLRFRSGQIDLVVTYSYAKQGAEPGQRTAPLNSRTFKLLEEMLGDAEVVAAGSLSFDSEHWPAEPEDK